MIFDDFPKSSLTSIDRSAAILLASHQLLFFRFDYFSHHLKQILKFIQENLILAHRYCLAFMRRLCHGTGCHLKNVAVQRNAPSSSLRPLERSCLDRGCRRPIVRSRSLDP